jgi:hypothetical protein
MITRASCVFALIYMGFGFVAMQAVMLRIAHARGNITSKFRLNKVKKWGKKD